MNKRYQVFVSSTYEDLIEERRAVEEVIMRGGDIPVGMEAFPAADEEQFDFIKSIILESDYYVLIVAGRYGTVSSDGISFTEKEFDFAVSSGVPVLFLLRDGIRSIAADKSEVSQSGRKKLASFIEKASAGRLRKTWNSVDALKLVVRQALDHAKATKSRPGWIRGDKVASEDVLHELASARRQNDKLRLQIGETEKELLLPPLPDVEDSVIVSLIGDGHNYSGQIRVRGSWLRLFPMFFQSVSISYNDWNGEEYWNIDEVESSLKFGKALMIAIGEDPNGGFSLSTESFAILTSYYQEIGLVSTENTVETFTGFAKQLARRQHIAGGDTSEDYEVVGRMNVKSVRNLDDEIPF